jgi:hypothetical protein
VRPGSYVLVPLLKALVVAVTVGTLPGCGLVKQHVLAGHNPRQHVATVTGHILMSALKRKRSPSIVVKIRGLPAIGVMATITIGSVLAAVKLPCMNILMATGTL